MSSLVGGVLARFEIFVEFFMHELVNGSSKHPWINSNVLTLCNMMAGGGLICHVINALYYFLENFLLYQVQDLVDGALKSLEK